MEGYNKREILAILTAREIPDGSSVFVGIGISQLAIELARMMGKRKLFSIYEGGTIDPFIKPNFMPFSTNDIRVGYRALMYPSSIETFLYMQRGYVDLALMGAAQIDIHGNVNSSVLKGGGQVTRFPGSGGANDLASLAKQTIIVTSLEKRRFVSTVDYITSPGWLSGGNSRSSAGLRGGGPAMVITDKAIFRFDEKDRMMRLDAILEGVKVDDVLDNMGFTPLVSKDLGMLSPPSPDELRALRGIDPGKVFIG